jgi:3-deoxy-D-manno-octulosonate 8-phosphate phosphatase (KDO 8-P phosphatase)
LADRRAALARIRLLILDVDGTQTDGFLYYGLCDGPLKRFHIRDGQGVANLHKAGIRVAFISGDVSEATTLRARKLGIQDVLQGVEDKAAAARGLLAKHHVAPEEAAYMGDEPNDIAAMDEVGFGAAPADAVHEVRERADWVVSAPGGRGAVRELCDAILAARAAERTRADPDGP